VIEAGAKARADKGPVTTVARNKERDAARNFMLSR
jgi:hypothetical protein